MKKQTIRNNDFVYCVFGDRTRAKDNLYWGARVQVFQMTRDQVNDVLVYIVDDVEEGVLGIAVRDTHCGYDNALRVSVKDIRRYTPETKDEVRRNIFKELHPQS